MWFIAVNACFGAQLLLKDVCPKGHKHVTLCFHHGQVVLEVLERRVSIGSPVFESGHIVVLGWLENQRDEEVLWKLLTQVRAIKPDCQLSGQTAILSKRLAGRACT